MAGPPGSQAFGSWPFTLANRVSRTHSLRFTPRSVAWASSPKNSSSVTLVDTVRVRRIDMWFASGMPELGFSGKAFVAFCKKRYQMKPNPWFLRG
jgi:hypothetical protein